MRILVIEDEKGIADVIACKLSQAKYTVDVRYDGLDGYYDAHTGVYDLVILDVMLPNMSGWEILEKLRQEKVATKIIMLTALTSTRDKVKGLENGADDYLGKPFHLDELLARVRVQLRSERTMETNLEYNGVNLDLVSACLSCDGAAVVLSAKELQLMELFLRNPEQIFKQEYIYGKIWGVDADLESNSLEAYISFLRKKLRAIGARVKIVALRGLGYKIVKDKDE